MTKNIPEREIFFMVQHGFLLTEAQAGALLEVAGRAWLGQPNPKDQILRFLDFFAHVRYYDDAICSNSYIVFKLVEMDRLAQSKYCHIDQLETEEGTVERHIQMAMSATYSNPKWY